ncbi:sensor histidine kinase KdpD [bacterium]|nr:sensor histidine kinase KdpD [bacterium]
MQRQRDGRPNPQALLARLEHGQTGTQGRLKLFLGYAAGVGKTYAMLQAAHRELAQGRDVVIGYVETHQRPETLALLDGLPLLPRQTITHREISLEEFDLDGCLERHPQLVLVDELAHTNAPGSRHQKRYQDVEELLQAGIDVYSTLNIQHLESLNDVVHQITGVRVRETLPDSVLERATALSLVDLPPEELLTRLQKGHVYQGTKADAAARNFFRPGNLTALRELALRRAADRVDDDVINYMQRRSIAGPWPVAERLLVAVGPSPLSERLVRAARRLADALSAEWWAVSVRSGAPLSPAAEDRVSRHLQLAESLGARTEVVSGLSIPEAVTEFARSHNVTKIVAGKPLQQRWARVDLVDQLIRLSGDVDVFVVSGQSDSPTLSEQKSPGHRPVSRYVKAVAAVLLMTGACFPISALLAPTNLVMLYLLVVTLVAYWLGRGPSAVASALSVALFDFCFVPPYYTFVVSDKQYVVTFLGLLAVSLSISTLTARAREQALAARSREEETANLFALSRALSQAMGEDEIGRVIADYASRQLKLEVRFLKPDYHEWEPFQNESQRAVAMWAMEHRQLAGKGTDTLNQSEVLCLPILSIEHGQLLGGLVMPLESPLSPVRHRLLETYGRQAAMALERSRLSVSAQESDLLKATERLQSALLNSISHDLRIPLVSISGALQALKDELPGEQREQLLDNALSESDRLNRIVGNLLHMTRLESGVVSVNLQPQEPGEIVEMTLNTLRHPSRVRVQLPPDPPMVQVDFGLLQQALANLVENALKFSPPESQVEIGLNSGPQAELWVRDFGPGVAESERDQVFDRFYRGRPEVPGSGLGLSICKGLVEAQGGKIRVEDAKPGARFVISLNWAQAHE